VNALRVGEGPPPGNDLTLRFSLIVEALTRLRSRSCIIDGEAVCCDDNGMANFDRIRYRRHDASVFLYAFDLIELDGEDMRREPFETRKGTLAPLLALGRSLQSSDDRSWPPPRLRSRARTRLRGGAAGSGEAR
jgi:ATP-dependent DNA ligase